MTSEWIIAIATLGALLLGVWQIRQNGRLARQDTAIQMWMEYLRLGLDNPDLGGATIEENVRYHKEALIVLWPEESKYYSKEFGAIVTRVISD